jgi:hypothetical protein
MNQSGLNNKLLDVQPVMQYNNLCKSSYIPDDGPVWLKHVAEFT